MDGGGADLNLNISGRVLVLVRWLASVIDYRLASPPLRGGIDLVCTVVVRCLKFDP